MFTIENAEIHHLKQVKEIELECGLSHWSPADYRQEIGRRDSFFRICKLNDRIVGFILARLIMYKLNNSNSAEPERENDIFNTAVFIAQSKNESENEVEIYNIGSRNKYRRIGVGTILFKELLQKSRQYDIKKMWLEVRVSNINAIGFYESKGFKITGIRKKLYANPTEDGFVMLLDV